jgi:sirohydrochlorin cobaltochelatase
MRDLIEEIFQGLAAPFCVGQILVQKKAGAAFVLLHCDDASIDQLQAYRDAEDAIEIAKYDDAGNYRPLKTAPNLRHRWRLEIDTVDELRRTLDYFYPGRFAVFATWRTGCLKTTSLRETLERQSGMYRVAAKISDPQINDIVADFCRSDRGCLRTILWKRDRNSGIASTKLPKEKFDPVHDQTTAQSTSSHPTAPTIPLLCQEACNLLVAECRKVVKGENA